MTMAITSIAVDGNQDIVYIEDADSPEGQELRLSVYLEIALSGSILAEIRCYHLN